MSDYPELTLPQMLRENARRIGTRTAIRQKDFGIWNPITWAGYHDRAANVGQGLRALGLPEGGHVAIISENRAEWVLAQLGAGLAGAVTIGVYPTSPSPEVEYVLSHSEAEIVICEDQEQVDKVLDCEARLPRLRQIVVIEEKGMRSYGARVLAFAALEQLGAADRRTNPTLIDEVLARQSLSDRALMIYTSGSTGKPKGAVLSYRNLRAQAIAVSDRLDLGPDTVHLSYLPLCHVAEQFVTTMVPVYNGSQVNFGESIRTVQEDLREVAPNVFLGVPRIWEKLHSAIHVRMLEAGRLRRSLYDRAFRACAPMAEKTYRQMSLREKAVFGFWYLLIFRALQNFVGLTRCRVAMTGAAPIPAQIVQYFRTMGIPLVEVYGATETSGMILGQRLAARVPGAVGEPVRGAEVRLSEAGEVLLRGDLVFQGYYRNSEATEATIRDGWLHTGDVGKLIDGQYAIVDRMKDIMITAGGKNLSPSEIENTVKASPYIKECVTIGEGRKFVSALIQIDYETVAKWAEEQGIAYTNFRSLAEHPRIHALVSKEIDASNARMAQVARIRKFHLLTKELDHDDDEVTATMKVRRANVARKYAPDIERLYSEPGSALAS